MKTKNWLLADDNLTMALGLLRTAREMIDMASGDVWDHLQQEDHPFLLRVENLSNLVHKAEGEIEECRKTWRGE